VAADSASAGHCTFHVKVADAAIQPSPCSIGADCEEIDGMYHRSICSTVRVVAMRGDLRRFGNELQAQQSNPSH